MSDLLKEAQLKNIPIFSGLSAEELQAISKIITQRSYPKNTVIINEGDLTNSLYLINEGKVKIILCEEDGKEVIVSILENGNYFGELSLIDAETRSARVFSTTPCKLSIITKADFDRILESNPKIALNLLNGLSKRLRAADKNIESLALMDVYGRVARILLQYTKEVNGKQMVTEKLTQKDIANMTGSSREMVNRIFKDLAIGGYISVSNGNIYINEKLPAAY